MLKRFLTPLQSLVTVVMFAEVSACIGLAAFPSVTLWLWAYRSLPETALKWLWLSMLASGGYFLYGLCLIVVLPLARWLTFSWKVPVGKYPYVSFRGYQWASYNALILVMRYSFVNWIRATPFIRFFYRAMGMTIGARTQINTSVISDCTLITVGHDTVIGGDVTLIAHVVEGPNLSTAPVVIGNNVTVGLMTVIMPGCQIGDGAILAANCVLKKGTVVGPNEIWGGVPAKRIGVRGEKKAEDAVADALADVRRAS
jgi:acetyltransferase-like isoleucine patch superfamily enzyme